MELKEGYYIEDIGTGLSVTLDRRVIGECGQYVSVRGPSPKVCSCEMELTKRLMVLLLWRLDQKDWHQVYKKVLK